MLDFKLVIGASDSISCDKLLLDIINKRNLLLWVQFLKNLVYVYIFILPTVGDVYKDSKVLQPELNNFNDAVSEKIAVKSLPHLEGHAFVN
jgi:hypothetical protein